MPWHFSMNSLWTWAVFRTGILYYTISIPVYVCSSLFFFSKGFLILYYHDVIMCHALVSNGCAGIKTHNSQNQALFCRGFEHLFSGWSSWNMWELCAPNTKGCSHLLLVYGRTQDRDAGLCWTLSLPKGTVGGHSKLDLIYNCPWMGVRCSTSCWRCTMSPAKLYSCISESS